MTRFLIGFLSLLGALGANNARRCGLIGHAVARGLTALVGAYGTDLLVVALTVTGVVLIVPNAAWRFMGRQTGRLFHTMFRTLTQKRPTTARETKTVLERSRAPYPRAVPKPMPTSGIVDLGEARFRGSNGAVPAAVADAVTEVHKAPSPKEPEVRAGLKYLGYKASEIDHAMAKLDWSRPIESLLRDALNALKVAS